MSERLEDIMNVRRRKLGNFSAAGDPAYPASCKRTHSNAEFKERFQQLSGQTLTLAGRVRSLRVMGKIAFAHIDDGTARTQVLLREENLKEHRFRLAVENTDVGDFIETSGTPMTTKTGEQSLEVNDFRLLAKSLRPLPTEHFGLEDQEERLRRRYLDILLNPEVKDLFIKKNVFWQTVRTFLSQRGFLEVQTPVLEHIPGGADAEPFVTHYNALDQDFYLRISLELPLKRLLVAGYEKVFEIGRLFRNEGLDREHLQEYDDVEFYWAYADHEDGMRLTEELFREIVRRVCGRLETTYQGATLNWEKPFPKVDYFEEFKEHTGLDLNTASVEELKRKAQDLGVEQTEKLGRGRLIDAIYKRTVRPTLVQPCFLVGHPIDISPLSKRDPQNPNRVLRFQIVAGGSELCNAFAELNDADDQRQRFEQQMELRAQGDLEAQMLDEDFVQALEYGMPPAFGFGMSERFFAFLMDRSVRETVIFPHMRDASGSARVGREALEAVAVVNRGLKLKPWEELNTVAHLNAAFGARVGKQLFNRDEVGTQDGQRIKLNIRHAIMIKQASSSADVQQLAREAKALNLEVAEFTREMIETTSDRKVVDQTAKKALHEVDHFGVLVFGPRERVRELTARFPLYGQGD